MTATITYRRVRISPNQEKIIIRNRTDNLIQCQIRINGYLYKIISLFPNQEKQVVLTNLNSHHHVTVDDVETDIDLTLSENSTYYHKEFFESLSVDDIVQWRYEGETVETNEATFLEDRI